MRTLCIVFCGLSIALAAVAGCGKTKPGDEADDFYGDASRAFADGDRDQALELVTKAIDQKPTAWAHSLRGRIHAENKEFAKSQEDAKEGLALDPNNRDLIWLDTELKKPEAQRFKGANRLPPSATK